MPITEVIRILATAVGEGGQQVGLLYDIDGRMGADEQAFGYPSFWLRVQGESHGPYDSEALALRAAHERFGASFDG